MARRMPRLTLCLACWLVLASMAQAQDFKVYSQVYNEYAASKGPVKAMPITRSTTLFHAGRAFDFPTGGQTIIFEPSHTRFVIIDWSRRLLTTIAFDEINERIFRDEQKLEQYVKGMQADRHPEAGKLGPHHLFQITPKFQESYDAEKRLLALGSRQLKYEVKCDESQPAEILDVYLRYTDWASRLSAISRPHALLPGPRLALDDALRRRSLLPTEVVLRSIPFPQLHLKAVHRFTWQLDITDRSTITDWDARSISADLEHVSFDTFLNKTAIVAENKSRDAR